jgi:hypothetical protein
MKKSYMKTGMVAFLNLGHVMVEIIQDENYEIQKPSR